MKLLKLKKLKHQKLQNNPSIDLELALLKKGYKYIIGIDEAGRGSWAGPVAVGAYKFNLKTQVCEGIKDSKLLNSQKRDFFYNQIYSNEDQIIRFGEVEMINKIGIGNTITNLIEEIIDSTFSKETYYLIDGLFTKDFGQNTRKIIKGDLLHYSISCASILAKVSRDRLMDELSLKYPEFGFARNKGYGTKSHFEAIKNYGISKVHRINYKPIALIIKGNANLEYK